MTKRSTGSTDRRQDHRQRFVAPLRMTVLEAEIEGVSDNLSSTGLLFMSEDSLRVRIEVRTDEGVRLREGRLVRAERMSRDRTGFAIELDPE